MVRKPVKSIIFAVANSRQGTSDKKQDTRYIDPLTDTGFKIIFGKENQSNEILMAFLNELFRGQPGFEPIVRLRYLNSERSRDREDGRTIVHDIICETESGSRFIVEMQKQPQPNFLKRAVCYVCRAISEQGIKGRDPDDELWDYDTLPVLGVFISSFRVEGLGGKAVTHVRLTDTETGEPVGDTMRYAFIQLPAFTKKAEECETFLEERYTQ